MNTLHKLHDATLTSIELDWATGNFRASFILGVDPRELRIVGKDVTSFSYERRFPWGRSVSVNKCQIESKGTEVVLTIEMQSGDLLVGKGSAFAVTS
jgi:hypothetical protein